MSRYFKLSPVERDCPSCDGFGRRGWDICPRCDGVGHVFKEGGPLFGCRIALEDAKPGQIATIANGDRGRIIRHCQRGTPSTEVALIEPLFGEQDLLTTTYPSATGVISLSVDSWFYDPHGDARAREDHLDPLQTQRSKP